MGPVGPPGPVAAWLRCDVIRRDCPVRVRRCLRRSRRLGCRTRYRRPVVRVRSGGVHRARHSALTGRRPSSHPSLASSNASNPTTPVSYRPYWFTLPSGRPCTRPPLDAPAVDFGRFAARLSALGAVLRRSGTPALSRERASEWSRADTAGRGRPAGRTGGPPPTDRLPAVRGSTALVAGYDESSVPGDATARGRAPHARRREGGLCRRYDGAN